MIDNLIGALVYNIKRIIYGILIVFLLIFAITHLDKVISWIGKAMTAIGNIYNFLVHAYAVFESAMNHIPS